MPLYRQETILKRIGVELPRATLANWMIQAGHLVQPINNLLRDRLFCYKKRVQIKLHAWALLLA